MSIYTMYSADQNCSPFWDTWPKLEVLTRKKKSVFHLVHDTDTIFHDQSIKDETPLTIKWFHDKFDGSHYYSPNLFYFQFLGKHEPFPVNQLESYTGFKLSKISSLLNISVEVLYEKFGSYDKLALLGKGKYQNGFRIAAGVKVSECTEQIEEMFRSIQDNMLQFIVTQEQNNNLTAILSEWKLEVDKIIASNPDIVLANLFSLLMESKFNGKVSFSSCFDYFHLLPQNKDRFCFFLSFLREYHKHAQYYNEALCRNNSTITPLDISKGELPFYAIRMIDGRLLRFPLYLHGHQLICQEKFVNLTQNTWEDILNWCQQVGIASIVGKAIPLMMQLRHKEYGGVIAMPKLGSPYMAIVDTYAELLNTQEMYPEIKGVSLVDFQVFKALHNADFSFKLPIFLQEVFKKEVIHCQDFVEQLEFHINESNRVLDLCKQNMETRKSIMKEYYPSLVSELSLLEKERQSQGHLLASLSKQSKDYQQQLEQFIQIKEKHKLKSSEYVYKLCHLLFTNWHVSQLNYFNNRGSIELWAKTLGGLDFYQSIIDHAIVQD
ncbi:hypothetical protein COM78_20200 [Bacillus thuringiensis]|uniref:hypothetical protein n=1 Tax=Bacillus thuringiensis TaxID=1428 RepID=UPI000BEBD708|nr:hypothetical protein [Bacillus thuringiensis]PDX92978.1 hypothetical protein COM78_20200 [Bacillus thuringiensis]